MECSSTDKIRCSLDLDRHIAKPTAHSKFKFDAAKSLPRLKPSTVTTGY